MCIHFFWKLLYRVSSNILPSSKDLILVIRQRIRMLRKTHWQSLALQSNKLAFLKNTPDPWTLSNQPSRKHVTIFTRLRIRHTRITHTHTLNFPTPPHQLSPLRQQPSADIKAYVHLPTTLSSLFYPPSPKLSHNSSLQRLPQFSYHPNLPTPS